MNRLQTLGKLFTVWLLISAPALDAAEASLQGLMANAKEVLDLARRDNVAAAKRAWQVVEAAKALEASGDTSTAADYMRAALQLDPWNPEAQLWFSLMQRKLGHPDEADAAARVVLDNAEEDTWYNAAAKALDLPKVQPWTAWDGRNEEPFILVVRVGTVQNIVLRDLAQKLEKNLGLKVCVDDTVMSPPPSNRNNLHHWMRRHIIPQLNWDSPDGRAILRPFGARSPDEVDPERLLGSTIAQLRHKEPNLVADLIKGRDFWSNRLPQWDASPFMQDLYTKLMREKLDLGAGILVLFTECDLYSEQSNFLFGTAATSRRVCLVSSARFTADFNQEPTRRERLVSRLYKQCLCGIGFSLGVPRPTDPTSARAYPDSLMQHDAKSEYMSEACIRGFEEALHQKLPDSAHKPAP